MLHLEFFCPSVGYTQITPEFTVVLNGQDLSSIETGGRSLFPATDVVLKSAKPIFQADGTPEVGGYASFRRVAGTRGLPARGQNPGLPADALYSTGANAAVHLGIMNLDLVSGFFTVPSDNPLSFESGSIRIDVYDSHDWRSRSPMQTISFRLPKGQSPTPDLVVQGSHVEYWVRPSDSAIFNHPTVQAPHWWAFNQGGALVGRGGA